MNLVNGIIIDRQECDATLEHIEESILTTLQRKKLDISRLIDAGDYLVKNIDSLSVMSRLTELGISPALIDMYLSQIKNILKANNLRKRLDLELGEFPRRLQYANDRTAAQTIAPLGVILHITAGNVDGLPFLSVLEGLLCGNINIVKLPRFDGGITVSLLLELFSVMPELREYVYVFDYSSKDLTAMKTLSHVADAIVVWGGDEAIAAIRRLAKPNTRIIEWGHKISFAYAAGVSDRRALVGLARNICVTNQLFCSSCQGVFVDTDNMEEVYAFCRSFLPVMAEVGREIPIDPVKKLFSSAAVTLDDYRKRLTNEQNDARRLFRGDGCSIVALPDERLESSVMYRNLWVKPLPRERIVTLRKYNGYLQNAALLCSEEDRPTLSESLIRAGIVKVCNGEEMSSYALGEAHDGIFPLRMYTRTVSVQ